MNTLRQLLVRPKDKNLKERVVRPVYRILITLSDLSDSFDASYIGETEIVLKARFLEHRRPGSTTSEVSRHILLDHSEHQVDMDGAKR